jgi:hypothetical protein
MRCYNGAWDSEATAMFARLDELLRRVRVREPEAHCTYFPSEGQWQVHVWGRELSGMHASREIALNEALRRME